MTACHDPHDQTAYAIYTAFRIGAGLHATGRPYPVYAWHELPDCYQERYRNRARELNRQTGQPLPIALYNAWHVGMNVVTFGELPIGLKDLWRDVAEAYRELDEAVAA